MAIEVWIAKQLIACDIRVAEVGTIHVRGVSDGKLLELRQERRVVLVSLIVDIFASSCFDWRYRVVSRYVYLADIVPEVNIGVKFIQFERWIVSVNDAEGDRELVWQDFECIIDCDFLGTQIT